MYNVNNSIYIDTSYSYKPHPQHQIIIIKVNQCSQFYYYIIFPIIIEKKSLLSFEVIWTCALHFNEAGRSTVHANNNNANGCSIYFNFPLIRESTTAAQLSAIFYPQTLRAVYALIKV